MANSSGSGGSGTTGTGGAATGSGASGTGATTPGAQGAASGAGAGGGTGAAGSSTIAIDVEFTLITPDKLRKIEFGLTKTVKGTDVLWTITFELYERTSATATFPTDADISLSVKVDPTLNDAAEKASSGLTPPQEAQATGPAAVAAKAAKTNPALQPVANLEIQKVVQ